jgi:hypothetical protein
MNQHNYLFKLRSCLVNVPLMLLSNMLPMQRVIGSVLWSNVSVLHNNMYTNENNKYTETMSDVNLLMNLNPSNYVSYYCPRPDTMF